MLLVLISHPPCFVTCRAITVLCRPAPRRGVSGTRPDAAFGRVRTGGPVDRHGQPFWLPVPRYSASRPENALRADGFRRCNRRMGEVIRHALAVLPAFLLACLAVAAPPGRSRPTRRRPSSRSRSSRSSCPGTARSSALPWRWLPSRSYSTPATAWESCCSRPGPGTGCPAPRYAVGWNASSARPWWRSASTWPPRPAEPSGAGSAGRGRLSPESGGRRG